MTEPLILLADVHLTLGHGPARTDCYLGLSQFYRGQSDLAAAQAGMAAQPVNARWQATMAEFFVYLDDKRPDEGFMQLRQIFHLA